VEKKLPDGLTNINEEVRELTPEEYSLWDDLVERSPQGTIFHTSSWLILISKYFNNQFKIVGCFHGKDLIGGCSLFFYSLFMGRLTYVSSTCDFTQYGGFVISEKSYKIRENEKYHFFIIQKICDYIHEKKFDRNYIEITNSPGLKDIRPFIWGGWTSEVLYTYYINLQKNPEQTISKDIRKKINYCNEHSITVKKSSNADVHYNLLSKVFQRQHYELPPRDFFRDAMELLERENRGEMWIAESPSGDIIASRIVLWDTKRAYAWSAASDPDFEKREGNAFLLFNIIQKFKERGFKEIDVMQANMPRLKFFITGFNPDLSPNYKIYKKNGVFFTVFKKLMK
jgi:hypothetical protein